MQIRINLTFPALLLVMSAYVFGQTSDTTPPTLQTLSFTPTSVDVTGGPQDVTVTARITDDLSGVWYMYAYFSSPTNSQYQYAYISRVSGDSQDGMYSGTIEIPEYSESGTWLLRVVLRDYVGNYASLDAMTLDGLGFPTELTVFSNEDLTPPTVTSATVTPGLIDVSSSDQVVTLNIAVTDDVAGIDLNPSEFYAYLDSPGFQQRHFIPGREFSVTSADPLHASFEVEWTVPQDSEAGTWSMIFGIRDKAGNFQYVSPATSFDVTSATPDLEPPVLIGLLFSPAVIDTSAGSANVLVRLELTDNATGVDFSWDSIYGGFTHGLGFASPSTAQDRSATNNSWTLVEGTANDGAWESTVYFPQYSEDGTWGPRLFNISDHVHNWFNMDTAAIAAAGFPTELVVVRPSLEGDGTVNAGGGTVQDDSFPDRASITFPSGALAGDTNVAIDVFPDPLAVPTPEGYEGPGTYFVNFDLTPEPTYPFPAPGVSVTLPLVNPMAPGTLIPLFFVNNTTGTLVPMLDVDGNPVIGTVNAGGLSATFNGISHFTILVALIPDVIPVSIDIKPDSSRNPINTTSRGTIPVAILSTQDLNAITAIDQNTLTFGATGNESSLVRCNGSGEDVNGDGLRDLVCHFQQELTGFSEGDTEGILHGMTWNGEDIAGSDTIQVVP